MGNITMTSFITVTAGEESEDNWIVQEALFQDYKANIFSLQCSIIQLSEEVVDS